MSTVVKVKGNASLVRDVSSNAIINTSNSEYNSYMLTKQALLERKSRIEQQEDKINKLEQDVSEIKEMLKMLIKGKE